MNLPVWTWSAIAGGVLCTSASWTRYFIEETLVLDQYPPSAALRLAFAMVSLGLLLLGSACVLAYRKADESSLSLTLRVAVAVHLIMAFALPLYSTDLFSYLAYGELAARGFDIHLVGPIALGESPLLKHKNWLLQPSVYGPVADLVMTAAGRVGHWCSSPEWIGGLAYKSLNAACDIGGVLLIHDRAKRVGGPAAAKGFALFALNPVLAWHLGAQAHNDVLIVFFAAAYLWFLGRGQEVRGLVALTLGFLAKFVVGPVIVIHLWQVVRENWRKAVGLGFVVLALVVMVYAATWSEGTIATWTRPFGGSKPAQSLFALLDKALRVVGASESVRDGVGKAYDWIVRLAILGSVGYLCVKLKGVRWVPLISLATLAFVLSTTKTFAPWYFSWLLPFAAVQEDEGWQRWVLGASVLVAFSYHFAYVWMVQPVVQLTGVAWSVLWMMRQWRNLRVVRPTASP